MVCAVANVGVAGNALSMFVLLRRRLDLQPFLRKLLVLLTCFDTAFLVSEFLLYSLPLLYPAYRHNVYPFIAPKMLIPISQVRLRQEALPLPTPAGKAPSNIHTSARTELHFEKRC